MRKFRLTVFVLVMAAMLIAACQPANQTANNPQTDAEAAEQVEAEQVPAVQEVAANPMLIPDDGQCTVTASLIPEIPADQIPPVPLATEDDWIIGDLDAEIQIIEYSDFQCPYCAITEPELARFQADYADRVNVVFRHFPLISIHPKAMPAARAAEAAGAQGKFWEMHDIIFNTTEVWATEAMTLEMLDSWFVDQAESLGLDVAAFEAAYNSPELQAKLDAAYDTAINEIGLSGTPSVFIVIDGVPFMAPNNYEGLAGIMRLIDLDKNRYTECPPVVIDQDKSYTATIKTTKGDVVVELFADAAPMTVNSFVYLARDGYFKDVAWHRVIPGFVAQAGDPSGSGMGGPGYEYSNEVSEDLLFDAEGVLGMANAGVDTNGSQFFITYAAQPNLDGGYTVFGKVLEGMDVVSSLNPVDPQQGGTFADADLILDVEISENDK